MNVRGLYLCLAPVVLLAACNGGAGEKQGEGETPDAATQAAQNENLATDPDLSGSDEAGAAISGTGNQGVPKIDTSPEAVEAARSRAAEMVGGRSALKPAPQAKRLDAGAPDTSAMVQAARAVQQPGGRNCFESVNYSTAWAAKLPAEFPVYPRANTMEAAGSDEGACAVRAVTFRTGVPLSEVLAFYNTRASAAGFRVEHVVKEGDNVLSAIKGDSAVVVYARQLPSNVTEIDLVTSKQ